jgi:UDP-N-acetylglucosamine 1-carboxyvinyltransferase
MAATLAEGVTILKNCACEPEIKDLALTLIKMGAEIQGAGTPEIVIHGRRALGGYEHTVMRDRIEAGTFLIAGALIGKNLIIQGVEKEHQGALLDALSAAGVDVVLGEHHKATVSRPDKILPLSIDTAPFPGFPTDMQAQWMCLMALAEGQSTICETIFENRFMHVAELNRMGAHIKVSDACACVEGVVGLSGATVMATDLRASACLVLAGLVAEGETHIRRLYHLDRGYESIEKKLGDAGARLERYSE